MGLCQVGSEWGLLTGKLGRAWYWCMGGGGGGGTWVVNGFLG